MTRKKTGAVTKKKVVYKNDQINVEVEFYNREEGRLESAVGFNGKKSYCRNNAKVVLTKDSNNEDMMKVKVNNEDIKGLVYGYTAKDNVIVVRSLV